MIFKEKEISLDKSLSSLIKDNFSDNEKIIENHVWLNNKSILVIKMRKYKYANEVGVEDNNDSVSLDKKISEKRYFDIKFIVIFAKNNRMFYTSSQDDLKKMLCTFFDITQVCFIPTVKLNQFASLKSITLTRSNPEQCSIEDHFGCEKQMADIHDLADALTLGPLKQTFSIKSFNKLRPVNLKKYIQNLSDVDVKLEGKDQNGNVIIYATKNGAFKLELYSKMNFDGKKELAPQKIYDDLCKKLGEIEC